MFLGYPECDCALIQLAVYLAKAPKSNSAYVAVGKARKLIKETGALPVPHVIRNGVTSLMKDLGYGKDYKYAHAQEKGVVEGVKDQQRFPDELHAKKKAYEEKGETCDELLFYE